MPTYKKSFPKPPAAPPKKRSPSLFVYLPFIVAFSIWFVWRSLTPTLPTSDEPPKLYSNQCQQDLTLTFLEAIKRSTRSIYLVMFGLSDPAILRTLKEKTDQEVSTQIYYDTKGSPNLHRILQNCEIHPIRQTGFMHQKLLILDEEMVFLGSANMTASSLRMHDNLVIGLCNKKIAAFLKETVPYTSGHMHTLVGGQEVDLWILPDPKGHAISELKKKIRRAQRTIKAALFTFTHPTLLDELILAHKRGVHVTLVIDMHSGLGASAKNVAALKKAGIRILFSGGAQLMHHKFVYIDEQTLIAGSANWTKAAFTKNSDCIILLNQLTHEQKSFMNYLWRRIATTAQPPQDYRVPA